ncbi:MAG TPA: serine protease [Candidatus Dormibacteraeota bacterium]|jgi:hypothetical protein|nr:serine protease [Candidatus Dormibacteraeota bacterium]
MLRQIVYLLSLTAIAASIPVLASASKPQDYAARIVARDIEGNTHVGTVIYVSYAQSNFVVTAYHNVFRTLKLNLTFDEKGSNQIPLSDFVGTSALLDPLHDLAIFRCTPEGSARLQGSWNGIPINLRPVMLKTEPQTYDGARVVAVGNPALKILEQEITPLNYIAEATVSEYSELGKRLISLARNPQLSNISLVFLENLEVTYGFSGGPVLFSKSQFKNDDVELVGMVEGGDPSSGSVHSWAIPVDVISSALRQTPSYKSFPPTTWPATQFPDTAFSRSSSPFITILQVTPWSTSSNIGSVPLQVDETGNLSITFRAAGKYQQLFAILHVPDAVEIQKAPSIERVNDSGLFSFIWTVKPSSGAKGGPATIEFTTEKREVSFTLPLTIRLVDEANHRPTEAVLPFQFQEIQQVSENFNGKTEIDLRDAFGFGEIFKTNTQFLLCSYRQKAFHEKCDVAHFLKTGTTIKILEGGGGTVDKETGTLHPIKSNRLVKGLILPSAYTERTAIFKKFGDSLFLTEHTRKLIAEYLSLVDENTTILGDVLNDSASEFAKRYPQPSDPASDIWINNRWVDCFKNLSPKAREIQNDLRTYVFKSN